MSSHFKWYPSSEEVVVPWNARYSFPSQANKAIKITPRIPPKNGTNFSPGNIIRVEFPAQGYVNPINTTFSFDVTLSTATPASLSAINHRFQNNIQSIFSRVRLMYGSTPLEDIINYDQIVRNLTEWTATSAEVMDQTAVTEGIAGRALGSLFNVATFAATKARSQFVQSVVDGEFVPNASLGSSSGISSGCTRRYQVNLALGLLMQEKLIPVKFMASQLAIEITLSQAAHCIFAKPFVASNGLIGTYTTNPTYQVSNFNMIPEILEFDSSYDAMFLKGLQDGGVPIKFSSWHTFLFGTGGSASMNLQVQERSRSVKALFACLQKGNDSFIVDNGATIFELGDTQGTMVSYQWRIGGRYFPAQPVEVGTTGGIPNGAAEAYIELQKALNIVGDYRLSTSVNPLRWGVVQCPDGTTSFSKGANQDTDYEYSHAQYDSNGVPSIVLTYVTSAGAMAGGNCGSSCYASAIDLETSNGVEISGLNAEEQSDIAFIAKWSTTQSASAIINVFCYYDSMLILRENNVLELIQ